MDIIKEKSTFTVTELYSTRSGDYAVYIGRGGMRTSVRDYNFKVGDHVVWYTDEDGVPITIEVNGKITWNEEDHIKWWKGYDPDSSSYGNPFRKKR